VLAAAALRLGRHLPATANHIPGPGPSRPASTASPASTTQPTSHHDQAAIVKGQPYGACQTVTALASGRRPQRPIAAGSRRHTRDVFRTGNPGEASSVTDAHNWAFRVTQKRQPTIYKPRKIGDMRDARAVGLVSVSVGGRQGGLMAGNGPGGAVNISAAKPISTVGAACQMAPSVGAVPWSTEPPGSGGVLGLSGI
jgi:hypothetical protein